MRSKESRLVDGKFVDMDGERYYAIHNVDKMPPFFMTVVSANDHWLFVSSLGGLTAGRVSPAKALFPYITVDKIHENYAHTGCKTIINVIRDGGVNSWEPFNYGLEEKYRIERHLYKNRLGNKLCFEEINHDLQLVFKYTWKTSDDYGFVRQCELKNNSSQPCSIEMLDGLQNIMPAGTPKIIQANSSNLVDAYKWSELDEPSGVALFTLYSGIIDRPEPCESLYANTTFCLGLEARNILLSSLQLDNFRANEPLEHESHKRGIRGAFLVNTHFDLAPNSAKQWKIISNVESSQSEVVALCQDLLNPLQVNDHVEESIALGSDSLSRIMSYTDGFQVTNEERSSTHHYANVLFNTMRGGVLFHQNKISRADFSETVKHFNIELYKQHKNFLDQLPEELEHSDFLTRLNQTGDIGLERLACEYLPISFGRRHGDPSRPWNDFAINLKDESGAALLNYQGNWRDIFQNWEAMTLSFPEFIEPVIAKFVNASTMDGFNPYRVTKDGIDWEIEDPEDPWSYIGYWGDHQIIYLLKLLEHSQNFHPNKLNSLLRQPLFSYANVPYRIHDFKQLLKHPKQSVTFDHELDAVIHKRVSALGADGKFVTQENGGVLQVNLLEKLLIPLLSKLGNLVVDGGIWLNTQRPEWNDANNAIVGDGLSMVTVYYLRRYIKFLMSLVKTEDGMFAISLEVAQWLDQTVQALVEANDLLAQKHLNANQRYQVLEKLGNAFSDYRALIYKNNGLTGSAEIQIDQVNQLLSHALNIVEITIKNNVRDDGLFNAYNLMDQTESGVDVKTLYTMLEGQVAALSSGLATPKEAINVFKTLFDSDLFREDQFTFMLYPDRKVKSYLEKNIVPSADVEALPVLKKLLADDNHLLVTKDIKGNYRFNSAIINKDELQSRLSHLKSQIDLDLVGFQLSKADMDSFSKQVIELYENVFNHKEFTGRSGTMFGFEGLGSIYWHMNSKLLLAAQENYFWALDQKADQQTINELADFYYKVRKGIGFNKTPEEYGAFPTDPYSHTPKHAGAQQPGMTGQVKEEVLTRFGELGIRVSDGKVSFQPSLLKESEFIKGSAEFKYLNVHEEWCVLSLAEQSLAFTWCQTPIVYCIDDSQEPSLNILLANGDTHSDDSLSLNAEFSQMIFKREGKIRQLTVSLNSSQILSR